MKKLVQLGALIMSLTLFAAGCGKEEEKTPAQKLYPVSINGSEIKVGETKVQTLLDAGLKVTVSDSSADFSEITQFEIDPEQELEANTYYSGGSVWITDSIFANISVATEEACRMGDAVIARLEFSLAAASDEELAKIAFDGAPVNEITREKAGEMCPDFTGDENMWLQYGTDYKYDLNFDADGKMIKFAVEKEYDVDWLQNNGGAE